MFAAAACQAFAASPSALLPPPPAFAAPSFFAFLVATVAILRLPMPPRR
jgi:hypothetical protein